MSDTTAIEPFTDDQLAYLARAGLALPESRGAIVFAVPTSGRIPDVADGDVIESAWGNGIRDRVINTYPDAATLRADTVSLHGFCNLGGPGWTYCNRTAGQPWRANTLGTFTGSTDASGIVTIAATSLGFTTLEWVQAGASWGAAAGTIWLAQARIATNQMQIRAMIVQAGGTISAAVSTAATLHWQARGIV